MPTVGEPPPLAASIVVPAYRAEATLAACLDACLAQDLEEPYEVVLSVSADDPAGLPAPSELPTDGRLRVLSHVPRRSAAEARNAGAAASRGRLLAFTDADAVPSPGWLRQLVAAGTDGTAVAGAVVNGTPDSAAGTVEWLVEFLDLHPRRPARTAWHGATVNLAVPASVWAEHGPFPTDLGGCEDTLLTARLRADGRLSFCGDAAVVHLNRTAWRAVLRNQWRLGRWTARLSRLPAPYKLKPLVRWWPLAPVAAAGRVVSLYARVAAWDRALLPRALALLPGVAAALAAWGAGLMAEGIRLDVSRRSRTRGAAAGRL